MLKRNYPQNAKTSTFFLNKSSLLGSCFVCLQKKKKISRLHNYVQVPAPTNFDIHEPKQQVTVIKGSDFSTKRLVQSSPPPRASHTTVPEITARENQQILAFKRARSHRQDGVRPCFWVGVWDGCVGRVDLNTTCQQARSAKRVGKTNSPNRNQTGAREGDDCITHACNI